MMEEFINGNLAWLVILISTLGLGIALVLLSKRDVEQRWKRGE
jgi:hypothetical protein